MIAYARLHVVAEDKGVAISLLTRSDGRSWNPASVAGRKK